MGLGAQFSQVFEPRKMGVASGDPFASSCLYMYKKNVKTSVNFSFAVSLQRRGMRNNGEG